MKSKIILILLLVGIVLWGFTPSGSAAPIISQRPSMDSSNGYSFSSETQVPSAVADDFLSNGLPITGVTWWGSYWDYPYANSASWGDPAENPPGTVSAFIISFWSDIPAGHSTPPWSHPGTLLHAVTMPLDDDQVKESVYDTIDREGGITQTVFEYEATLAMQFAQEAGQIYWLSIQAVDSEGSSIHWGWQESMDGGYGNAVQNGFPPGGLQPGWWHLLPGEDMAFELTSTSVPVPASVLLLGAGLLGLVGFRRRMRS